VDPPVREEDARAVLERWLAAQNAGDFPAYEALYAPRFEGVRRSGSQTAHLDRARWMKDRAKMFEQKTTVSAKDVQITPTTDGATVSFVQSWAQAGYRDEGPKRIVMGRAAGKLLIAREELLRSTVVASGSLPSEGFFLTVTAGGPHLVLKLAPADAWLTGPPRLVTLDEPATTRRSVDASKLPLEVASWAGKRVELFGKKGVVCDGVVTELAALGRVIPHFGAMGHWTSTGDFEGKPKPSPAAIAADAWALSAAPSDNGRVLTAEIKPDKGDCAGALWGRALAADKPVLVEGQEADAATRTLALAELHKTQAYVDTQSRYAMEKEKGAPALWEQFESTVKVTTFAHPIRTLVALSIRAGSGCGNFGASMSAVWEKKGGALTLVRAPDAQEQKPLSAGDVDGDGGVDLISAEVLSRSRAGKLEPPVKIPVPFLDCGC